MRAVFRLLFVLLALASTGAPLALADVTDDPCCEDEGSSVPDCLPGISCVCCPANLSLPLVTAELRPLAASGESVLLNAPEPVVSAYQSEIFRPPRA
jgi:hypothetical protein